MLPWCHLWGPGSNSTSWGLWGLSGPARGGVKGRAGAGPPRRRPRGCSPPGRIAAAPPGSGSAPAAARPGGLGQGRGGPKRGEGGSPFGVGGGQPPTNIRQGCSNTLAKLYTLNRHFTHSYIVIELNVTLLPTLLKFKSKIITIKPFLKKKRFIIKIQYVNQII